MKHFWGTGSSYFRPRFTLEDFNVRTRKIVWMLCGLMREALRIAHTSMPCSAFKRLRAGVPGTPNFVKDMTLRIILRKHGRDTDMSLLIDSIVQCSTRRQS